MRAFFRLRAERCGTGSRRPRGAGWPHPAARHLEAGNRHDRRLRVARHFRFEDAPVAIQENQPPAPEVRTQRGARHSGCDDVTVSNTLCRRQRFGRKWPNRREVPVSGRLVAPSLERSGRTGPSSPRRAIREAHTSDTDSSYGAATLVRSGLQSCMHRTALVSGRSSTMKPSRFGMRIAARLVEFISAPWSTNPFRCSR